MGGAAQALAEEEPGDDAAEHPEDEGDVAGRLGLEADLEDKPEDGHVDGGVDKGPEYPQVGAEVLAPEVLPGQLDDHPPAEVEIADEDDKDAEIIHDEILLQGCASCKPERTEGVCVERIGN